MKKIVDGVPYEMSQEEVAEMQALQKQEEQEAKNQPPTTEERLDAIESAIVDMMRGDMDV